MQVIETAIAEVKLLVTKKFGDARGFFSETWSKAAWEKADLPPTDWIQDNHAYSAAAGVLRGLHFQKPPYAQAKLVRCTRGRVLDVAVDIRHGSPTFGKHVAVELAADNWTQIFVPRGFAHAYCTIEPHSEVLYKVDNTYAPDHDAGLAWDDPALQIMWPKIKDLEGLDGGYILSDKDRKHPTLDQLGAFFTYSGA